MLRTLSSDPWSDNDPAAEFVGTLRQKLERGREALRRAGQTDRKPEDKVALLEAALEELAR